MSEATFESSLADHIYHAAKAAGNVPERVDVEKQFVRHLLKRLNDDGHANLASRCGYFLLAHSQGTGAPVPLAMKQQVGGTHYKSLAIQPVEFIQRNGLGFCEGNAVKYLTRWKAKGGIEDLLKARHYIDLLLEMNEGKQREADIAIAREINERYARELLAMNLLDFEREIQVATWHQVEACLRLERSGTRREPFLTALDRRFAALQEKRQGSRQEQETAHRRSV